MGEQSIGTIIRTHRKKLGLTQKDLADQLNITDKAVSKWERDLARPDITLIPKLADILEVPLEVLLGVPVTKASAADPRQNAEDFQGRPNHKTNNNPQALQIYNDYQDSQRFQDSGNDPNYEDYQDYEDYYGDYQDCGDCQDYEDYQDCGDCQDYGDYHDHEDFRDYRYIESYEAEYERWFYRLKLHALLKKGLIGFLIGFIFMMVQSASEDYTLIERIAGCFMWGLFASSIPYGWEIVTRITGGLYVVGHPAYMLIAFGLKLGFSIPIGLLSFFPMLVYNFLRSRGKTAWKSVLITALILFSIISVVGVCSTIHDALNPEPKKIQQETVAETTPQWITDASVICAATEDCNRIFESVLEKGAREDEEDRQENILVTIPTHIDAAYFLSVKDEQQLHHYFGKNIYFHNAIVVMTHWQRDFGFVTADQWGIYLYPNIEADSVGGFYWDGAMEYFQFLGNTDFESVYDFMTREYADMTITSIPSPEEQHCQDAPT